VRDLSELDDMFADIDAGFEEKKEKKKEEIAERVEHDVEHTGFFQALKDYVRENKDLVFFFTVQFVLTVILVLMIVGIVPPF